MKRETHFVRYWLPPIVWGALIFAVSSLSLPPKPMMLPYGDKLIHALIYAVLSLFLYRALTAGHRWPPWTACALAILLASLYGITDEIHQRFVPTRQADVKDWMADVLGACATVVAAASARRFFPENSIYERAPNG